MAALWELYRTGFAVHSFDGCSVALLGTGQKPSFQEKTRFQCKRELYGNSIARDLLSTRLMVAALRFWVLARNRVFKKKLGFNAKGGAMAALWELYRTGFAGHSFDGCSVALLGTGQKPSFQEKTRFQCKRELYRTHYSFA